MDVKNFTETLTKEFNLNSNPCFADDLDFQVLPISQSWKKLKLFQDFEYLQFSQVIGKSYFQEVWKSTDLTLRGRTFMLIRSIWLASSGQVNIGDDHEVCCATSGFEPCNPSFDSWTWRKKCAPKALTACLNLLISEFWLHQVIVWAKRGYFVLVYKARS